MTEPPDYAARRKWVGGAPGTAVSLALSPAHTSIELLAARQYLQYSGTHY